MNRPDLEEYLNSGPSMVLVHNSCQRKFTDVRAYKRIKLQEEPCGSVRQLRSTGP